MANVDPSRAVISSHARARMAQYGISESWVRETLRQYIDKVPGRGGRTIYWRYVRERDRTLAVIIEVDGATVVTTHFDRDFHRRQTREPR